LVFLSTQTFVGGVSGVTATATLPATIAPAKNPINTFEKEERGFMVGTFSRIPERMINVNPTYSE
jgi:hypothetical protein